MAKSMANDLGISRAEAAHRVATQANKADLADRLTDRLGSRAAGAYIDQETGRLVVNVTTQGATKQVRSTTAQARVVDHSLAHLKKIKTALAGRLIEGATLAIDAETNTVVATIPDDSHSTAAAAFARAVRSYRDAARLERTSGTPKPASLAGGEGIISASRDVGCSGAFVLDTRDNGEFLLTAGHCDPPGDGTRRRWDSDGHRIGRTEASIFKKKGDFGLIDIKSNIHAIGQVVTWGDGAYNVSHKDLPPEGTGLCKSGVTTHLTCGLLLDRKVIVNYDDGPTVGGLMMTNICIDYGDSGGAVYSHDHAAVGIVSGFTYTIPCSSNSFRSYHEDVVEAVNSFRRGAYPHIHVE